MKKYGLSLAGGGAKGAYQFGVWTALRELGIEISGVVGTSIGALNGAAIVQGDYDALFELWNNLKASYVLNISDEVYNKIRKAELSSTKFSELIEEVRRIIDLDGLDISPLKDLIHSILNEDKIRRSGMDFGLVTVSLSDLKAMELFVEDIPENQMSDYLLATAYLPFFKHERLQGKYFLDGMYYNNLPTNMLVEKGYTDIIEVHLKTGENGKVDYGEDIHVIEIRPSQPLGRALDFDQLNSRKNIDLGYYDTLRVFKKLAGDYYYFDSEVDESAFIRRCFEMDQDTLARLYDVLGLWSSPQPRGFFEEIVPELIRGLNLDRDTSYRDFMIAAYEHLGKEYGMTRFELYDFSRFAGQVRAKAGAKVLEGDDERLLHSIKKFFSKEEKVTMALEVLVSYIGSVE
ncbi:MAG: patatin-like phospholipase family protein [Clostridia bacterium]|nr:patatin-like phospholipase family protein [Clostridia bacterium]